MWRGRNSQWVRRWRATCGSRLVAEDTARSGAPGALAALHRSEPLPQAVGSSGDFEGQEPGRG